MNIRKAITLLWMFIFLACHTKTSTVQSLCSVDSLMSANPDSNLIIILQQIQEDDLTQTEDKAYFTLLLSPAYCKDHTAISDDSLIKIAYDYYSRPYNRDIKRQAMICHYMGQFQMNTLDFKSAIASFLEAIKYGKIINDYHLLGLANTRLALIYEDQDLFAKAADYYDNARANFSLAGLTQHTIQSLIKIGNNYGLDGQHLLSLNSYQKAHELAKTANDTVLLMAIARNRSSELCKQDSVKAAKEIILDTYVKYNQGKVPNFYADNFLLGIICSKEGRSDSARFYFNMAQKKGNMLQKAAVENELYKLESTVKNYREACEHLYNYHIIVDSIYSTKQQAAILEVEKKYQTTQLEYENYRYRTNQIYINTGRIISIVLIAVISLILYRRHKRIVRDRDLQIKNYLFALSKADNTVNTILNTRTEKEKKLKELLEKRFSVLQKYYDVVLLCKMDSDLLHEKLVELICLESIEKETFTILRQVVAERHPGLMENLKNTHPELTDSDIDFLFLILTGFSVQQMCAVYNATSSRTIYTRKYRLALKLNLKSSDTLHTLLCRKSEFG